MAALMTRTNSSLSPSAAAAGSTGAPAAPAPAPGRTSSAATRSPRRATSRRNASTASRTRARSVGCVVMAPSGLQRDQAVLLGRPQLALGVQVLQGLGQVLA